MHVVLNFLASLVGQILVDFLSNFLFLQIVRRLERGIGRPENSSSIDSGKKWKMVRKLELTTPRSLVLLPDEVLGDEGVERRENLDETNSKEHFPDRETERRSETPSGLQLETKKTIEKSKEILYVIPLLNGNPAVELKKQTAILNSEEHMMTTSQERPAKSAPRTNKKQDLKVVWNADPPWKIIEYLLTPTSKKRKLGN